MIHLRTFIKTRFGSFVYFYRVLRYRIFIALALTFTVGLLDGLGLAMFMPLIKLTAGEKEVSGEGMGGMEILVNAFVGMGIPLTLVSVLLIMLVFFMLKGIATFVRGYYNVVVRTYFIQKIRFSNIDGLANFRYKQFVLGDSGRIQNTMSAEVGRVMAAYNAYFATIQNWIMMLVYLGLAFFTNPQFAVLVIAGGILSTFLYRKIYKLTKEASSKISVGGHRFQRELIQMVANFKYLKATGYLEGYGKKLKASVRYILLQQKKIGAYNAILGASKEPLNMGIVVLVILLQIHFFEANLGTIILSLLFFYRALNFIMALQTSWNGFLANSGALENMTEFVNELNVNKEEYGTSSFKQLRKEIKVDAVDFYYQDTQIIKDLTLCIPKNQTVAFVGESGSGKTTLVNLISGLMPSDKGRISIDGTAYADLDLRSLQRRVGYISQDPVIFSDSIFDNISKWEKRTPENEARFWQALEQAAIADFVRGLPEAENTMLGNNGIQLSGGQKQRMSIARELYKDIDILVMDEATSALDSETERAIQENIEKLKGKYTILIVAHRLSTIKEADKIFVLKQGELLAAGNFSQLMKDSLDFKKMIQYQEV